MTDFLLELRSEEIPARMQDEARQNLKRLFEGEMAKAGLKANNISTYATPRRLALIVHGLPLETSATSEETKGPKVGAPPQALEGFLRKTGLTQDQLVERDGVYFAVINKPGRKTADVLAEAIPAIIRAFSWPKSMRWGAASASTESLRWVRPLQGIVALLGDDVVPCEVDGIASGSATMGHRFHHSGIVTIGNDSDYAGKLRACHVIVDQAERQQIIREGAAKAAADAGLTLVPDEALVAENAGLTEWPVPLLGRFDAAFLAVPPEVIRLTAKLNQKYFMCTDAAGKLANAFVCTANISATDDGKAIIAGNERVLAARLSDAKFFYEQDLKVKLAVHGEKLSKIVFHEKLGTVADKVARVAKLARWLVESGVVKNTVRPEPVEGSSFTSNAAKENAILRQAQDERVLGVAELADMAEQAARLCKADLVTGMVGEFPELQGVMGGYYARAQGLPPEVADAIRDHYKPVGQGDDVPTAPVTVAVSLADKLDTLVCFYIIAEVPTGSRDPFALRRAALGVLSLIFKNSLRIGIRELIWQTFLVARVSLVNKLYMDAMDKVRSAKAVMPTAVRGDIMLRLAAGAAGKKEDGPNEIELQAVMPNLSALVDFFAERLKVQQKEAGVRHDLIDAVFALGGEDDLVRLLARVQALQAFITTEDGVNLLAGYKRAANILKAANSPLPFRGGDGGGDCPPELTPDLADTPHPNPSPKGEGLIGAEQALLAALNTAEPQVSTALEAEDFTQAMSTLATLRAPIDQFFADVMVNDPDPAIRAFRLGLLARFRDAVQRVADFSKIEG